MPHGPHVGEPAESFTLADQFGAEHAVAFDDGAGATVLVFADRRSADAVRPWVERLVANFGAGLRVVGIAAVGAVPSLFHGLVRGLLHGEPGVLIDWDNRVSDRFGYEGGECLLVVVDPAGQVSGRVTGPVSDDRYARVVAAIPPIG